MCRLVRRLFTNDQLEKAEFNNYSPLMKPTRIVPKLIEALDPWALAV